MKHLIILMLLFLGVLLMAIGLVRDTNKCPKEKVIYKYVPRTFDEEQDEPVFPSEIFKAMFTQSDPWIGSINDLDTRKKEPINKYFVSQM